MRTKAFYRGVFAIAAAYDLVLGALFFLFYAAIYAAFNIQIPDNTAYIHLASAFVFVQGLGYYFVYRNLKRNIDIVKVGLIYKIVYTALAFYDRTIEQLPHPMFALFGVLDLVFVVLFTLYLTDYTTVIAESN